MAFDDELRNALHGRADGVQVSANARQRIAQGLSRAQARHRRRVVAGGAMAGVLAVTAGVWSVEQFREDVPRQEVVANPGSDTVPRLVLVAPAGFVLEYVEPGEGQYPQPSTEAHDYQVFRPDSELSTVTDAAAPAVSVGRESAGSAMGFDSLDERSVTVRGLEGVAWDYPDRGIVGVSWSEDDGDVTALAHNLSEADLVAWLNQGTFVDGGFSPGTAGPVLVETFSGRYLSAPDYSLNYRGPEDLSYAEDPNLYLSVSSDGSNLAASSTIVGLTPELGDVGGSPALITPHGESSGFMTSWERDGLLISLNATSFDRETALGLAESVHEIDEAAWDALVATAEGPAAYATPGSQEIVAGPDVLASGTTPDAAWTIERTTYADGSRCDELVIGDRSHGETCSFGGSGASGGGVTSSGGEEAQYLQGETAGDVTRVVAELHDGTTIETVPALGTDGRNYYVLAFPGDSFIERLVQYRADGSEADVIDRPTGGPTVLFEQAGVPIASGELDGQPWTLLAAQQPTNVGGSAECGQVEFAQQHTVWSCALDDDPNILDHGGEVADVRNRSFFIAWSLDAASVRVSYADGEVLSANFAKAPEATHRFAVLAVDLGKSIPASVEYLATDGSVLSTLDPTAVRFYNYEESADEPAAVVSVSSETTPGG